MAAAIRPGSGSLKSVSVVRATVQVYAPPVSARRASAFADGRCSSTGARTRDRLADGPYVRLHGCAVRGVGASAHGRSPFHPRSTASSPGSARKNFWRVVIVEVRPAGAPARTSCSAQGLPSPELDPAPLRWRPRASNDAVASSATEHRSAVATQPHEPFRRHRHFSQRRTPIPTRVRRRVPRQRQPHRLPAFTAHVLH